jgi:hypothetical protein
MSATKVATFLEEKTAELDAACENSNVSSTTKEHALLFLKSFFKQHRPMPTKIIVDSTDQTAVIMSWKEGDTEYSLTVTEQKIYFSSDMSENDEFVFTIADSPLWTAHLMIHLDEQGILKYRGFEK